MTNKYIEKIAMRAYDRVRMLKLYGADRIEGEAHKAFLKGARKADPHTYEAAYHASSITHSPELKKKISEAREAAWKKTQGESYLSKNEAHKIPNLNREAGKKGLNTEWASQIIGGKMKDIRTGPARSGSVPFDGFQPSSGSIHLHPSGGSVSFKNQINKHLSSDTLSKGDKDFLHMERDRLTTKDKLGRGSGFSGAHKGLVRDKNLDREKHSNAMNEFYKEWSMHSDSVSPKRVSRIASIRDRMERSNSMINLMHKNPILNRRYDRYSEKFFKKWDEAMDKGNRKNLDEISLGISLSKARRVAERNQAHVKLKSESVPSGAFGLGGRTMGDYAAYAHTQGDNGYVPIGKKLHNLVVNEASPGKVTTNTMRGVPGRVPVPSYMTRDYSPIKSRMKGFEDTEPVKNK